MIDLSDIPLEERDRNSVTRGGKIDVDSPERAVQQQRELNTLMVIYTAPADIPTTPREPSDPYSGEVVTEQRFGSPPPAFRVGPHLAHWIDCFANSIDRKGKRMV